MLQSFAACMALVVCWAVSASAQGFGRFEGQLILKPLPDGRTMELLQPFTYVDSKGVRWPVPARTRVDGASIPRPLWSIIGAPYTGKYREASVIHDYYCERKSRHWKAVHRMFLESMLARGVNRIRAELMYLAVYRFGPRWDFDADMCFCRGCPICANPILKRVPKYDPKYNETDLNKLREKLLTGKFSLEQLEDVADYQVNTEIFGSR